MSLEARMEDDLFASKNRKEKKTSALGVIMMILLASLLAVTLILHMDANGKDRAHLENLITANYEVDSISWAKPIGFSGKSFVLSIGGATHRCGGITEENLLAKKQIICADGKTINAK